MGLPFVRLEAKMYKGILVSPITFVRRSIPFVKNMFTSDVSKTSMENTPFIEIISGNFE